MRRLVALFMLALSGAVQAAPVTIDFEEFSAGDRGDLVCDPPGFENYVYCSEPLMSKGYTVSMDSAYYSAGLVFESDLYGSIVNGADSLALRSDTLGPIAYGAAGAGVFFSMERTDGGAFAIYSLDWLIGIEQNVPTQFYIHGWTMDGREVDYLSPFGPGQTVLGTGDWLNLKSFRLSAYSGGTEPPGPGQPAYFSHYLQVDNIVVSAVPVPAAVWLFVSALGLLGVQRRTGHR